MTSSQLEIFVCTYLHTAAWCTVDGADECDEFTKSATQTATVDCRKFAVEVINSFGVEKANELLSMEYQRDGLPLAAHDFWLTRNGHGSGFWDKPEFYGESEAEKLTEISKTFRELDVYHVRGKKSKLTFY